MTGREARPLIVAVAEAGGPLGIVRQDRLYVTTPGWTSGRPEVRAALAAVDRPHVQDNLIGELTRDLERRGIGFEVQYTPEHFRAPDEDAYLVTILNPQPDGEVVVLGQAGGDSQLAAMLEAWTDAAQLAGWGA